MLNIDIKNITFQKKIESSKKIAKKFNNVLNKIHENKMHSKKMFEWKKWASSKLHAEILRYEDTLDDFKKFNNDYLVVIGIGGSYLGAKAVIDFELGNNNPNNKIIFVGTNLTQSHFKNTAEFLKDKKWAICVISKSGSTLETGLSFRYFENLLAAKVGQDKVKNHIIAITDKTKGTLREMAEKNGYFSLPIPDGIGGRFSVFTAVGLFPIMFAGINVKPFIEGFKKAEVDFEEKEFNYNPALQYAALRYLYQKKSGVWYGFLKKNKVKAFEIFSTFDIDQEIFLNWIAQLFGESEGKKHKGLYPTTAVFTRDLHSLGQFIQEGKNSFVETFIKFEEEASKNDITFAKKTKDDDDLNKYSNLTLREINDIAYKSVVEAHKKNGKREVICITMQKKDLENLGYLMYFLFIAITASCLALKVDPFTQPGVEVYKKHMKNFVK